MIAQVTSRNTANNIKGFQGILYNLKINLAVYNGIPKTPYNKHILLTGKSLLNSQERVCITPNTSPKN